MNLATEIYLPSLLLCVAVILNCIQDGLGIGCFICSSINGSEPRCEDTFSNTGNFYKQNCLGTRQGRKGKFPGTQCIKLKAEIDGYRVLVRDCAVDSGGTNSDTEIGRESHCWIVSEIIYDNRTMRGCTVACSTDGCNGSSRKQSTSITLYSILAIIIVVIMRR